MEALKLGEREQQYYAELFQACDVEGSGKVTGPKASELFLASGLNPDILKQITELCGAKRLGHFGRSQFYIALKLVAFAQAGLPLKLDASNPGKDIPLPKFSSKGNEHGLSDRKKSCGEPDSVTVDSKANSGLSGQLPPPPGSRKSHMRSLSGQYRGVVPDAAGSSSGPFAGQTDTREESPHNSKSPPFSPPQSPPMSPASQKPLLKQHTAPAVFPASLPTTNAPQHNQVPQEANLGENSESMRLGSNSGVSDGGHMNPVALGEGGSKGSTTAAPHPQENGNWAMFEDDESHMLLGSGIKQHYNSLEPPNFDSSSISSEAESVDDPWTITDELREYYINQFKTMQPDLNASITGPVAKHFFEKSKLPVVELSKIWQLSDLNCDGALSMEEFCIAMHLVVLRRNDIELPDHLPISLMPYASLTSDEPFAADLPPGSTLKRATPPSPQNAAQWTAFVQESSESSGVASPAHLANFEFSKPSADPELKIIQPVAVRMSPENFPLEGHDRGRAFSDSALLQDSSVSEQGDITPPLTKQRANTESHPLESSQAETPSSKYNTPIQGRPRPVPKKQNSVPAIVRGQLQPPPASNSESGQVADEVIGQGHSQAPPTPPPRPVTQRSMSVDVKQVSHHGAPAIPPRVSPKEVSNAQPVVKPAEPSPAPEQTQLAKAFTSQFVPSHRRSVSLGGLRLTREPGPPPPSELPPDADPPAIALAVVEKEKADEEDGATDGATPELIHPKPPLAFRQGSRDRREMLMAVRTHKERNSMLTRLNSELNQELQEVMEQRIALEIQLEHLRPFSS